MNPEQPAERSNAAALRAPSWSWMMQEVAGIGTSGVTVAQMRRSRSEARTPEARSASSAARVAKRDIGSDSVATWRSRIPVRERIHSSEVSTIRSRSVLVRTLSGSEEPVPRMIARRPVRAMSLPRWQGRGDRAGTRVGARRQSRDLVMDPRVDPIAMEIKRDPHSVLDRPGRRPAVTDDGGRAHAQERNPPIFGVIDLLPKGAESRTGQQVSEFGPERFADLFLQEMNDGIRRAFDRLQRDVADESVTDDHVRFAVENIAPLDVADEVEGCLLEHPPRLARELVSLAVLFADAHQADARRGDPQDLTGIKMSHDRELHQMLGPAVDVGADVEPYGRAGQIGDDGAERGALDPLQNPADHFHRGHDGAGVAGAHHPLSAPFADQKGGHPNRRILLTPEGGDRRFVHADDFGGRDDL